MAVRPIVLYPDRRLKTECPPVPAVDDSVRALVQDLIDTIDAGPPRTVGIAAPQVGELTRVAIVDIGRNPKYTGGHGFLCLINPRITAHSGEQFFREGCLSIPEYTANVRRWERITVSALDLNGAPYTFETEGFESVVVQHEIDHLDGLLFLDRVANVKTDVFQRKPRPEKPEQKQP